jgi:Calx-beta domain
MTALVVALLGGLLPAAGASAARKLSVGGQSVPESVEPARFVVMLSKKAKRTVTVDYATSDGTATHPADYAESSGTLKIKRKKKTASFKVPIAVDDDPEEDESFTVSLSNPRRASIGDGEAVGEIRANDGCEGSADTDGDGILDCLDACPDDPNPDGPCPVTLYNINDGTVPSGSEVAVNGVTVTAVSGTTAWVGHQSADPDFAGADNSAIEVDVSGVTPAPSLAVGERVNIGGTATPDLITADDVTEVGSGTPVATVVDSFVFGATPDPALDAVLVRAGNTTLNSQNGGDWQLNAGFEVDNLIMGTLPVGYNTFGRLLAVIGIAETSGATAQVRPRTSDDIVPGLFSFTSALEPVCIGLGGGSQAFGTLALTGPSTTSTSVAMTSSDNNVATVPATITIPQGSTFATVDVTPVGTGPATITATLGDDQRSRDIVVAESCPP